MLLSHIKYHPIISDQVRRYYRFRCRNLKKMVFVATTGRSGTMTLGDIFNAIPGCKAEHEPYPAMIDDVLAAKSSGNEGYVKDMYWRVKSINLWRAAAGYQFYFESNHMFVKTYIEYAVEDFGDRTLVIHLVRDPAKVANSIYALQDFPGTIEGNKWWLDYRAENNLLAIPDILDHDEEFKHPFYKGLWYWYEMEARIASWKRKLPRVTFLHFRTEDFNDHSRTCALLKEIGVDFDPDLVAARISTKSNTRPEQKIAEPLPSSEAEERHQRFRQFLHAKGLIA
jgi:hypothetical protein